MLREERQTKSILVPDDIARPAEDLIRLSRAAVARARDAITLSQLLDRLGPLPDEDIREIRENAEQLIEELQNQLVRERRIADSTANGQNRPRRK